MSYIDDLLLNEQDQFGSGGLEPEYLTVARRNQQSALEDSIEQKKRLKALEDIITKNPREREREAFQDIFKQKWGFNPSKNIGTKIGASAIEVLTSLLGGGTQKQAQAQAQKDYSNSLEGYKQLFGSEINASKLSNQEANQQLTSALRQKQMEEQARQFGVKIDTQRYIADESNKIKNLMVQNANKNTEIKGKLADSRLGLDEINKRLMLAKITGLEDHNNAIRKYNETVENPALKYEIISGLKGQQYLDHMVKYASEQDLNNILTFANQMAQAKDVKSDKPKSRLFPEYTTDSMGNAVLGGTKEVQYGGQTNKPPFRANFQRQTGDPIKDRVLNEFANRALGNAPTPPISGNPISGNNPVQKLKEAATIPEAKPLVGDSEKMFNEYTSKPMQYKGATVGSITARQKEKAEWDSVEARSNDITNTALSSMATGKLQNMKGILNKNFVTEGIRTMMGKSAEEINMDFNQAITHMKHLKANLGGRPSHGFAVELEKNLNNNLDSPEAFVKRMLAQSLTVSTTARLKTDPRYNEVVKQLDKEYKNQKGTTMAEVASDMMENRVRLAKAGKSVQAITPEEVVQETIRRRKAKGAPIPKAVETDNETPDDFLERMKSK